AEQGVVPAVAQGTDAASLFLFPTLKLGAKSTDITAVFPTSTGTRQASPLPTGHSEEAFLGGVLVVPRSSFIGFTVDEPFSEGRERMTTLFTNGKLPDATRIGINWTVSNLNRPWFAGSSVIPHSDTCNGSAWRKLIIEGLKHASAGGC
ncbi:MAG: hypothetical protein K0Q60_4541, partial [Microvirga sp.]|nr:hypothetical protein [Microvirga sp.]